MAQGRRNAPDDTPPPSAPSVRPACRAFCALRVKKLCPMCPPCLSETPSVPDLFPHRGKLLEISRIRYRLSFTFPHRSCSQKSTSVSKKTFPPPTCFFLGGCDSFAPIPGNWSCPRMVPQELSEAIRQFPHDTKI